MEEREYRDLPKRERNAMKAILMRQRYTRPRFHLPYSPEIIKDVLSTAYEAEITNRNQEYVANETTDRLLSEIAGQLTSNNHRLGLMLCGGYGNGKTTLVRSIQKMLNAFNDYVLPSDKRVGMRIMSATELVALRVENPKGWKEKICDAPLLAIDDLGIEPAEVIEFGNRITPLADLLSYRYDRRLYTIVTTNIPPSRFSALYGERIADRMREMFHTLPFHQPSYRH